MRTRARFGWTSPEGARPGTLRNWGVSRFTKDLFVISDRPRAPQTGLVSLRNTASAILPSTAARRVVGEHLAAGAIPMKPAKLGGNRLQSSTGKNIETQPADYGVS